MRVDYHPKAPPVGPVKRRKTKLQQKRVRRPRPVLLEDRNSTNHSNKLELHASNPGNRTGGTSHGKGALRTNLNKDNFLPYVDRRTWQVKKIEETYLQILSDLGGEEFLSQSQKALAKQASMLIVVSDDMMHRYLLECFAREKGLPNPHDLDICYDLLEHLTVMKTLRAIVSTMHHQGLQRVMRPANPDGEQETLDQYLDGAYEQVKDYDPYDEEADAEANQVVKPPKRRKPRPRL